MGKDWTLDDLRREAVKNPEYSREANRTAVADALSLWLVEYRSAQRMSTEELASLLGLDLETVMELEDGDVEPPMLTMAHISRTLNVPLELKLDRTGDRRHLEPLLIDARMADAA